MELGYWLGWGEGSWVPRGGWERREEGQTVIGWTGERSLGKRKKEKKKKERRREGEKKKERQEEKPRSPLLSLPPFSRSLLFEKI